MTDYTMAAKKDKKTNKYFFLSSIQFSSIANICTILSYFKSVTSGDRNCYPSEAPVFTHVKHVFLNL
jgi:hypothetical protein